MVLQIFIAIMALNSLNASTMDVLHPEKDPLITRMATQNTEQHTSWSVSVWSVMSSAYHMVADRQPTQEEVLREKLKGIVFPDGKNAAGELVRDYKLPLVTEVEVNQDDQLITIMLHSGAMSRTDNIEKYLMSLKIIVAFASKGNKHALSTLDWLFSPGSMSRYPIIWPYANETRARLFETAQESLSGSKTPEEIHKVLGKILEQGSALQLGHAYETKKSK